MASHVERTLERLRRQGRECGIVERFIHNQKVQTFRPGIRSDLFGMFDIVAMSESEGIIGIQVCGPDRSSHIKKITTEKRRLAMMWIRGGGKIELWAWRKLLTKRGGCARTWQAKVDKFTLKDFIKNGEDKIYHHEQRQLNFMP